MSQILSQEEVDALLRGVTGGEIETETDDGVDTSGVVVYDLTSQDRIIRGRMPTLEIINDRFARLFRGTLSTALRKVIDVSTVSTDMIKFGEFLKSLPVPTSIQVLRMDPLRGNALLILESKLVFVLVDTFFGGKGESTVKVEGRDFTKIENRIISKVVDNAIECLTKAWMPVFPLDFKFVRAEVNPQFVGIVPPTDVVVVTAFDVEMDTTTGNLTLCIPYSALEPIRSKLHAGFQSDHMEVDHAWVRRFTEQLKRAEVNITAQLGETIISGRDLLDLKIGDIIQLRQFATDPVKVTVEGILKYLGTPGVVKGNNGVKIAEKVTETAF
ncbi:MAG: flagellar motor switch protein FliM [Deltaproteobacteria bacterium]|nr:flagellar motor switch protein FliM [Deltaproteobacteria bacterium]MBF0524414.1 flagellar motor switch protein FliM [Deltaproteobacteria bacterium]